MPAKSEAERAFLEINKGHTWMKEHHFDNKGPLPQHVKKPAVTRAAKKVKK